MQKGHACRPASPTHRGEQAGFGTVMILAGVLVAIFVGGGGYWAYRNNFQNIRQIRSYEDCAKIYPVSKSYPGKCGTPDGKHFIQELSEEEKKKLVPPSPDLGIDSAKMCIQVITPAKNSKTSECKEFPTPCDVPVGWEKAGSCVDETAGWKTYTNSKYGFSFEYPSNWDNANTDPKISSDNEEVIETSKVTGARDQTGRGYEIIFRVYIKPSPLGKNSLKGWYETMELKRLEDRGFDISKISYEETKFNGDDAIKVNGQVVHFVHGDKLYQFSVMDLAKSRRGTGDYSKEADRIISTFKFLK